MRFENESLTYECFCDYSNQELCQNSLNESQEQLLCGTESMNSSASANFTAFKSMIFQSECILSIVGNGTDVQGKLLYILLCNDEAFSDIILSTTGKRPEFKNQSVVYRPNNDESKWCSKNYEISDETLYISCKEEFCNFKLYWEYTNLKASMFKVSFYQCDSFEMIMSFLVHS